MRHMAHGPGMARGARPPPLRVRGPRPSAVLRRADRPPSGLCLSTTLAAQGSTECCLRVRQVRQTGTPGTDSAWTHKHNDYECACGRTLTAHSSLARGVRSSQPHIQGGAATTSICVAVMNIPGYGRLRLTQSLQSAHYPQYRSFTTKNPAQTSQGRGPVPFLFLSISQ